MKVKIIKPHHLYSGIVDVDEARANYLIRIGVGVAVKETKEVEKKTKAKKSKTKTSKKTT